MAAIVERRGRARPEVLATLNGLHAHRGPDDEGVWLNGAVGLAHRRLSIIDLSAQGHQPMTDATGTLVISHNGEIYNYLALRRDLRALGVRFRTGTDTEILLEGYREWGLNGLLNRVDGMFAFLLYDARERVLFACRDRFGEKPLYWYQGADRFVLASELRAIWEVCHELSVDLESLDYYLSELCVPQPRTVWRQVRQVPPAHYLRVPLDGPEPSEHRYWQLGFAPDPKLNREEEVLAEIDRLLGEAVAERTVGDRPVAAFLSGGTDSGLVVASLARSSAEPVRLFTIGFEGFDDELPQARAISRQYGAHHTEVILSPRAGEILPALVEHFGEPFADSSAIPSFYLAREMKQVATVALSGDGGDEVFGGYFDYPLALAADEFGERHTTLRRKLVRWGSAALRRAGATVPPYGIWDEYLSASGARRLFRGMGFDAKRKAALCTREFREAVRDSGWRHLEETWQASKSGNLATTLFAASFHTRLPSDYLVKVDRTSMMSSLEVRCPFLDRELVEFAARIPVSLKLKGGTQKYLLRALAARQFDHEAKKRPKVGFTVPLGEWLRSDLQPLVQDAVLGSSLRRRGVVEGQAVDALVEHHLSRREDHAHRIWALLCLELWFRRFVDTRPHFGS